MKDIKHLFLAARNGGSKNSIAEYTEAVQEFFNGNPNDYILNLEYIIQSDIGLQTFKPFVEKNGLPIAIYDNVKHLVEKCITRCELSNKDDTEYKEAAAFLEAFRQEYIGCFMMEGYFHDQLPANYVETYYGSNDKGIPNRKLAAGLINKFGEAAIPDVIVTADSIGKQAMEATLQFIESHDIIGTASTCEWILEATNNISDINAIPVMTKIRCRSAHNVAHEAHIRNHSVYREFVCNGNDDVPLGYYESETEAIDDLIKLNEYKMTWTDELKESAADIQGIIYSLYENFGGVLEDIGEEVVTSVAPMLPGSTGGISAIDEGRNGLINTRNKKTGDIPDYIKRNHNIGYGEDDVTPNHTITSPDHEISTEPIIDDFKRPTPEDMAQSYSGLDDTKDEVDADKPELTPEDKKAINNFYYYTYNNSLNKNNDSYNRSSRNQDDHSRGKRINSDNIAGFNNDDKSFSPLKESNNPWELNIGNMHNPNNDELFNEGVISTALGIIFVAPIVLAAGVIIVGMISSKIMDSRYKSKTEKLISEILGKKVKSSKIYSDAAAKKFADLLKNNRKSIIDHFYKFKETGEDINMSPDLFFSFGNNTKKKLSVEECNADNMILGAEYVVSGLIKKSDIVKITKALNKLSPDIKFGISVDENLPGDDNGGDWKYFIKAGICEGGPDDTIRGGKFEDLSEDEATKWVQKQYDQIEKSGYVVATLSMSMAAKKFLLENFNSTGTDSTGSILENAVDDYYQEGIRDNLKKLAGRVKGFFTMKKSLANLQRQGTPAAIKVRTPMMLPGINIPIRKSTEAGFRSESSLLDISTVEKLFDLGATFTEDTNNIPKLSKNDIRNVVIKLRSKFNAEILFISNVNDMVNSLIGPASVIETDRKTIEKMQSGKNIDAIPSRFNADSSTFDKVILVNPKFMSDYMMVSSPRELEILISHEYGHVLTFHTLTDNDWMEYTIKKGIINAVGSAIGMTSDDPEQITAECNIAYYKLKPERIANEASHLDPVELTYALLKKKATGKMEGFDLDGVVNWKVPDFIIQQTMQTAQGKTDFSADDIIKNIDATISLYQKVITNKALLSGSIEAMDEMKLRYKAMTEAVGDADDNRPESDHPVKDILTDIDRGLIKHQQGAKRKVQDIQNAGRALVKPVARTSQWITNMVNNWKDADENNIKERMADPHARSNLFSAIKKAIVGGSLLKAGLLLNPVFLFLSATRGIGKNKREFRLRNEMIAEFKTEMEVIDEKIKDADRVGDNKEKYKLMRFKNELNKKLLRVGGGKGWSKII